MGCHLWAHIELDTTAAAALFRISASSWPTSIFPEAWENSLHFSCTSHSKICTHSNPRAGRHGLEYHLECSGVPCLPLRLMVCSVWPCLASRTHPFTPYPVSLSNLYSMLHLFPFRARLQPFNTVIRNLFGTRNWFCGRHFFHGWMAGETVQAGMLPMGSGGWSFTRWPLTSSFCVAGFLTGLRPLLARGLGAGDPCLNTPSDDSASEMVSGFQELTSELEWQRQIASHQSTLPLSHLLPTSKHSEPERATGGTIFSKSHLLFSSDYTDLSFL